jgi:hypothetical protein
MVMSIPSSSRTLRERFPITAAAIDVVVAAFVARSDSWRRCTKLKSEPANV